MKTLISYLGTLLALFLLVSSVQALKIEFHSFDNKQQEQLYKQLIAELRCVKCQNQNLAMSEAELAKDMREKAYRMIKNGASREDVIKYMTDRYGDFVLYKPPFISETVLLWVGPALFLIFSIMILLNIIKKQQKETPETLSDTDRESMRELLNSKKSN